MLPEFFEQKVYRFSLRDGTRILVRRVTPEDKQRIVEGFKDFSPRSRYMRFFSQVKRLTKTQLAYLTEIDYEKHTAWGAVLEGDPDIGLGITRYVRLDDVEDTAEIAISVIDPMQDQGIGTILLAAISFSARQRGITCFRSYMLKENSSLLNSLRKLYGDLNYKDRGVFEIDTPVFTLGDDFPDNNTGKHLKQRMEEFAAQATSQTGQE